MTTAERSWQAKSKASAISNAACGSVFNKSCQPDQPMQVFSTDSTPEIMVSISLARELPTNFGFEV